jgi:hypothetical protein
MGWSNLWRCKSTHNGLWMLDRWSHLPWIFFEERPHKCVATHIPKCSHLKECHHSLAPTTYNNSQGTCRTCPSCCRKGGNISILECRRHHRRCRACEYKTVAKFRVGTYTEEAAKPQNAAPSVLSNFMSIGNPTGAIIKEKTEGDLERTTETRFPQASVDQQIKCCGSTWVETLDVGSLLTNAVPEST